jgi:hypothetical protein
MPRDPRTYITVHDGMPDHPKIEVLSDKAFRLLVTCWCWCSQKTTDGFIRESSWTKKGTPATRRELIAEGLVHIVDGGVEMHDYLEHQRSADEIAEQRATKQESGRLGGSIGNHKRWHVAKGVFKKDCEWCVDLSADSANGSANGRHVPTESISRTSANRQQNDQQNITSVSVRDRSTEEEPQLKARTLEIAKTNQHPPRAPTASPRVTAGLNLAAELKARGE